MDRKGATPGRLLVRAPQEDDRRRFVELFMDRDFMVFYPGQFSEETAGDRFDHMMDVCRVTPFGKQPVIELSSGRIVGYAGVDYLDFEGEIWLEWGYRLVPECRGRGYATEASSALLMRARRSFTGRLLTVIAEDNHASRNVSRKLGFTFWKRALVCGEIREVSVLAVGQAVTSGH